MEKDKSVIKHHQGVFTRIRNLLLGSRKRAVISVIVLSVLVFGIWRLFLHGPKKPTYQTAQVTRGPIIQTVSESGNIASGSQAGVGSPTTGIVDQIYVKDGDTVSKGDNLFKVKSIATAQEIASAYAAYMNAVNTYNTAVSTKLAAQATLEKDRAAVLDAQDAVDQMNANLGASKDNPATHNGYNQNEINSINSALTSSRETFSSDEQKYLKADQAIAAAAASENSTNLAYQATQDSVVTAPFDGTVANIAVKEGDEITASGGNLSSNISSNNSTTSTTNAVLYLGNFTRPYVKVQATEVDVPKIKAGQKVTITLDAFPGKTFVGNVDQVDTSGTISSGVVSYNVFVSFVAPTSDIRPGMSATVTIETARNDDTLSVPTSAVQNINGQTYVRILQNGNVSAVPVETGLTSDTDTEITSGLSEGQTVVTSIFSGTGSSGSSPFGGGFRGFGGGGGGNVIFRGGGGGGGRGG